jgi:hypothetical protein
MKPVKSKDVIGIIAGIIAAQSVFFNVDILFSYLLHLHKTHLFHIPILPSLWLWPNIVLIVVFLICTKVVMNSLEIQIRKPISLPDIFFPTFLMGILIILTLAYADDYYSSQLHRLKPILFPKTILYGLLNFSTIGFMPVFISLIFYILTRRIIVSKPGSNN